MADKLILAVSADGGIREMLELVLEEELGLKVVVASDGADALLRVRQTSPAVILLDWSDAWPARHRPDSREDLTRFKSNPATRYTPVLAVTFSHDEGHAALAAGCADYLAKPFDIDSLISVVSRHLPRELEMAG